MSFADYKEQIATETTRLSRVEKTAICLVCCKRLSPLYTEFVRQEQWGDASPFAQCRDEAIGFLRGECNSLSVTTATLDPLVPDTEDFGSLHGSLALNAGIAHLDLIAQVTSDDSAPVIDALLMCYETIDFCVQHELDPQCCRSVALKEIDAHAMMKRELAWQTGSLRRVTGCSDLVQFATRDFDDSRLASFMLETISLTPGSG